MFERAWKARPKPLPSEDRVTTDAKDVALREKQKRQRMVDLRLLNDITRLGRYASQGDGRRIEHPVTERTAYWLIRQRSFQDVSSRNKTREIVPFTPHRRYADTQEAAYEGAIVDPAGPGGIPRTHERLAALRKISASPEGTETDVHKKLDYRPVAKRLLCKVFLEFRPRTVEEIVQAYGPIEMSREEAIFLLKAGVARCGELHESLPLTCLEEMIKVLKKLAPSVSDADMHESRVSSLPLLHIPMDENDAKDLDAYTSKHGINAEEIYKAFKTALLHKEDHGYPERAIEVLSSREGGEQRAKELKLIYRIKLAAEGEMNHQRLNEEIGFDEEENPVVVETLRVCVGRLCEVAMDWKPDTARTRQLRANDMLAHIKRRYGIEPTTKDMEDAAEKSIEEGLYRSDEFGKNRMFQGLPEELKERALLTVVKRLAKKGLDQQKKLGYGLEEGDLKAIQRSFAFFEDLKLSGGMKKEKRQEGEEVRGALADGLQELMADGERSIDPLFILQAAHIFHLSDEELAERALCAVDDARVTEKQKEAEQGRAALMLDAAPWQVRAAELAEIFGRVSSADGSKAAVQLFEAGSEDGGPPLRNFIAEKLQKDEVYTAWRALRGFLLSKEVMEKYGDDIFYLIDQVALRAKFLGMIDIVRMFDVYIEPREAITRTASEDKQPIGEVQEVDRARFATILRSADLTPKELWQDVDLAPFTLPNQQNQT